jgi:5'-phosphate synthase pdxT subunit
VCKKIGVLALQGAFIEHINMLKKLGVQAKEIRSKHDFDAGLNGIILPGGESTAISLLLHKLELFEPIKNALENGMPAFGTCAGLILMERHLRVLDAVVCRHGFGRQINSFITYGEFGTAQDVPMVFIRGPYIEKAGANTQILAHAQGKIVAVQQGNLLATAFHPELTQDTRVHEYFLGMTGG